MALLNIANQSLHLQLDTSNARVKVWDLRNGAEYISGTNSAPAITGAQVFPDRITGTLSGSNTWTVTFQLSGAEVLFSLAPLSVSGSLATFNYPLSLNMQGSGVSMILPHVEGFLIPVTDVSLDSTFDITTTDFVTYAAPGLSMPVFGETNGTGGYIGIFETPYDSAIKIDNQSSRFILRPKWYKSSASWTQTRTIRYAFFYSGGYVGAMKYYRNYALTKGVLATYSPQTLRSQLATTNLEAMVGAINWWDYGDLDLAFVDTLLGLGIKLFYQETKDLTANLLTAGDVNSLQSRNIPVGRYDNTAELFDDASAPKPNPQWVTNRATYTSGWPTDRMQAEDLSYEQGINVTWGSPSGDVQFYTRHAGQQLALSQSLVPADIATRDYDSRLMDVTGSKELDEDFSRSETRSTDAANRRALLNYIKSLNLLTGTETGMDYLIGTFHWAEGMEMSNRWAGQTVPAVSGNDVVLGANFFTFNLGYAYRVPLYQLAYHDYAIVTWRWNWTPNIFTDDDAWKKCDLFTMLYGAMPILLGSKAQLETKLTGFERTFDNVAAWHQKVALEELVSHEFLVADGSVQRSRFSSGHIVVVNFSASPYQYENGQTVSALSFLQLDPVSGTNKKMRSGMAFRNS